MKRQFPKTSMLALLFTVAAACSLSSCATRTDYRSLYGTLVPTTSYADYSIVIHPNTRYVNVEGGEIVRFVVNDQSFVWHFMVARSVSHFDLKEVAPGGMLDHSVIAYVKPDPRYIGVP